MWIISALPAHGLPLIYQRMYQIPTDVVANICMYAAVVGMTVAVDGDGDEERLMTTMIKVDALRSINKIL